MGQLPSLLLLSPILTSPSPYTLLCLQRLASCLLAPLPCKPFCSRLSCCPYSRRWPLICSCPSPRQVPGESSQHSSSLTLCQPSQRHPWREHTGFFLWRRLLRELRARGRTPGMGRGEGRVPQPRATFGAGWFSVVGRGCPTHCWMLSSTPDGYSLRRR